MDPLPNAAIVLLLAPFAGSLLGVLIQRLPEGRPVFLARSACDRCGHRLGPRDLVPLLSFLLTRGRCRHCHAAIGAFPLIVELTALAVALWAVLAVPPEELIPACALGWTLLALSWIDLRTMLLPDALTLPLLAMGLVAAALTDRETLIDHGLAAGFGYIGLAGVAWLYRWLRGREGLGGGDPKLLAGLGAWLGVGLLPLTLLLAACIGLMAAGIAALAGRRITASTALPFGPCLALAGWLLWLYGGWVESWMMGWS